MKKFAPKQAQLASQTSNNKVSSTLQPKKFLSKFPGDIVQPPQANQHAAVQFQQEGGQFLRNMHGNPNVPQTMDNNKIRQLAIAGIRGPGHALPYLDRIQQSFGSYDARHIQAYTDSNARSAAKAMGARAYAMGNKIAFAETNPNLHTVAHETAHIAQQQKGVQLEGGVGRANDRYEQQAEKFARSVAQSHNIDDSLYNPASSRASPASRFADENMPIQMMQLDQNGKKAEADSDEEEEVFDTESFKGDIIDEYNAFVNERVSYLSGTYEESSETLRSTIRQNTYEALRDKKEEIELSDNENLLYKHLKYSLDNPINHSDATRKLSNDFLIKEIMNEAMRGYRPVPGNKDVQAEIDIQTFENLEDSLYYHINYPNATWELSDYFFIKDIMDKATRSYESVLGNKDIQAKKIEKDRQTKFLMELSSNCIRLYPEERYNISNILEYLFRAMAFNRIEIDLELLNDFFDNILKIAIHSIKRYKERVENSKVDSSNASYSTRPPIVPMAGFVNELFWKYHIPLFEIFRLLPFVRKYIEFHKKHSSWKKNQAMPRIRALEEIARLLNEWAVVYEIPELYRAPSSIELNPQRSPLVTNETIGNEMRAVLTINPGNSIGYEPEEYSTWQKFNELLPGFVRAHLLNKHVHGPGSPPNLGFISANDNTYMSQLGEEDIKRMVLEENRQIFYRVKMVCDMQGIPKYFGPEYIRSMVSEVHMFALEIIPTQQGGSMCFDFGEDFLARKEPRPRVRSSPEGGIIMTTEPPNKDTIGKLNPNWDRRKREFIDSAGSSTLTGLPPEIQRKINDAQRRLLININETDASKELDLVWEMLTNEGLDEENATSILAELRQRRNKLLTTEDANTKKRKRDESRADGRRNILYKNAIVVNEKEFAQLVEIGDEPFKRYIKYRTMEKPDLGHKDAFAKATTNQNKLITKVPTKGQMRLEAFGIKKRKIEEDKKNET